MAPSKMFVDASVFDNTDAVKPLLSVEEKEQDEQKPHLGGEVSSRFQRSSLILGLLVGFFVQLSTLGVNSLAIFLWGDEIVSKFSSKLSVVIFCFVWSFFTTSMAVIFLGFIRNLVCISFGAANRRNEDFLQDLIWHMEYHFVIGMIIGVCLAWIMLTDLLLGLNIQIVYSYLIITSVAILCCILILWPSSSKKNNKKEKETEESIMIV